MAKFYFINSRGEQAGPVEKEELIGLGVTRTSMVWTQGMANWTPAGEVPELAHIFQAVPPNPGSIPPNYQQPGYGPQYQGYGYQGPNPGVRKPPSYMWLAILTTLLCCLPFGIVSIVYASRVDSCWVMGNYEEAQRNSNKAKMWGILSAVCSVITVIIAIIMEVSIFSFFW